MIAVSTNKAFSLFNLSRANRASPKPLDLKLSGNIPWKFGAKLDVNCPGFISQFEYPLFEGSRSFGIETLVVDGPSIVNSTIGEGLLAEGVGV